MKRLMILMLSIAVLSGCAMWTRTGGPYTAAEQNLSLELPDGWMLRNKDKDDYLVVSRDGLDLQSIMVETVKAGEKLKNTKKKVRKGMLPSEASEVLMDNLASNPTVHGLHVDENRSVKIAGHPGFRTAFTYKEDEGLKVGGVCYGFMQGETLYTIRYMAAKRYYFDRDLKTFEKAVASVRLLKS